MNIKTCVAWLAIAASVFVASADPMGSQDTVEQGKWCNDFISAYDYAEKNNIPLLVFWANPGCSQCEHLEDACKEADFLTWQADRQLVMVFAYGTSTDANKEAKAWIKETTKLNAFPFIGVYWKSNTSGKTVRAAFSGRKTTMPKDGDTLQEKLMNSVDSLIEGWDPSGVTPTPTPSVTYTVKFVVDSAKATASGSMSQSVTSGAAATAPNVTAKEGWIFVGWDKSFDEITADTTVTAIFRAKEVEVDVRAAVYGKSQKLTALVRNDIGYIGTAAITIAKWKQAAGTTKVTVKLALFTGKNYTASATVDLAKDGSGSDILTFKNLDGAQLPFDLVYDAEDGLCLFAAENDNYAIEMVMGGVGGKLDATTMTFSAEIAPTPIDGYDFVVDAPTAEEFTVSNGSKFQFAKSPTLKYVKEDGEYVLKGLDDETKPNVTGLKLTYKSSTGIFTGSFKLYASNADSIAETRKPTLKKYTASVKGVIVDGVGYGIVTVKIGKTSFTGSCTIQ